MLLTYVIAHYLIPGHSNNHKPKILHISSLFFLILSFVFYQLLLQAFPLTGLKILGYASNIPPEEVINMTNQKRTEAGLSTLSNNPTLAEAAKAKGEHMLANNYWAHIAPDGTEPWAFFTNAGYSYRYAGENLARDFSNTSSAVDAWLASPTHRDNMLSSKYSEVGVAVVEGDLEGVETTIIVQLFGTQLVDTAPQVPVAEAQASTDTSVATSFEPTLAPSPATAAPIAIVSPKPTRVQVDEAGVVGSAKPSQTDRSFSFLISPFDTTKSMSLVTIVTLVGVVVVDGVIISHKRISRIGGRSLAHLAFMGMILTLVIIAKAGEVL
jgi:hypothetical protein